MAKIYVRSGKWHARFQHDGEDYRRSTGVQVAKGKGAAEAKAKAQAELERMMAEVRGGESAELPTAVHPFPTSLRTHSQRTQAMDNSPEPWYKTKESAEMERLEAALNLRKSGYATGTTAVLVLRSISRIVKPAYLVFLRLLLAFGFAMITSVV